VSCLFARISLLYYYENNIWYVQDCGKSCRDIKEPWHVTRPGGMIILCPGNSDKDNGVHHFLVARGCAWSRFEEPRDGWKRKYWKKRG
jgi:hypothetical protein